MSTLEKSATTTVSPSRSKMVTPPLRPFSGSKKAFSVSPNKHENNQNNPNNNNQNNQNNNNNTPTRPEKERKTTTTSMTSSVSSPPLLSSTSPPDKSSQQNRRPASGSATSTNINTNTNKKEHHQHHDNKEKVGGDTSTPLLPQIASKSGGNTTTTGNASSSFGVPVEGKHTNSSSSSHANNSGSSANNTIETQPKTPPATAVGTISSSSATTTPNNNTNASAGSSSTTRKKDGDQRRRSSATKHQHREGGGSSSGDRASSNKKQPATTTSSTNAKNDNNTTDDTNANQTPPTKTPEAILEDRRLSAILQEFVRDCVKNMPLDIIEYMSIWSANKKRPTSSGSGGATSNPSANANANNTSPAYLQGWQSPGAGGNTGLNSNNNPNNPNTSPTNATNNNPQQQQQQQQQRPGTHSSQRSGQSATLSQTGIMSLNLERPPSTGNTLRRLTCIILGAEKSNKEQFLAMLDTLTPAEDDSTYPTTSSSSPSTIPAAASTSTNTAGGSSSSSASPHFLGPKMSPALKDLLGSVRDRLVKADLINKNESTSSSTANSPSAAGSSSSSSSGVALMPCESDRMGGCVVFADLPSVELNKNLIQLTSLGDLVAVVVSARHGVADMALRRHGELYTKVLLAHSVGVKRAFVVLTDVRGVAPAAVENVEKEVKSMFQRCGFDPSQLQIVRGTNSSDILFDSIAKISIQSRIKYAPAPVLKMKATMIVLFGNGIKSGDVLSVFSMSHFQVRIDSIPSLIDRRTNQVTETDIAVLKLNQVASLVLTVVGRSSANSPPPRTAVSAPIVAYLNGRIVAMGNVAEMFPLVEESQNEDEDEDDEDFEDEEGEEEEEEDEFALSGSSPMSLKKGSAENTATRAFGSESNTTTTAAASDAKKS